MTEKKPRIGQFTLTHIDNGWLVRWDVFHPDLQATIPHILHHKLLEDCFETISSMDPTRPEPKKPAITLETNMPTVKPPVVNTRK